MLHIMLDLETMGTGLNPPIIQIAAVPFTFSALEASSIDDLGVFDEYLSLTANKAAGLEPEAATMGWWLGQSKEALNVIVTSNAATQSLTDMLKKFSDFLASSRKSSADGKLRIWGNGSIFDNRILMAAYGKCNLPLPWKYNEDRDLRTLLELGEFAGFDPKSIVFSGIQHDAFFDCCHQITQAQGAFAALKFDRGVTP